MTATYPTTHLPGGRFLPGMVIPDKRIATAELIGEINR